MSKNAPKAPAPAPTSGITPVSVEAAAAGAANLAGTPAETLVPGSIAPAAPGDGMATAEAADHLQGAGPLADPTPTVWPEKARIVSVNAPMLHLYTNVWFDQDSKKVPVAGDDWLIAQLEAKKLAISED